MSAPPSIDAAVEYLLNARNLISLNVDGEGHEAVRIQTGERSDRMFLSTPRPGEVVALLKLGSEELGTFQVSSVIEVSVRKLRSSLTQPVENYVRVTCRNSSLNVAFLKFLENIRSRLERGGSVKSVLNEVVNEWRQLLAVLKNPLTSNQIIGIFGELVVLEILVTEHGNQALDWWYGSDFMRHDFSCNTGNLEIKTTTDLGSHSVTIHGLDQLDPAYGFSSFIGLVEIDPTPRGRSVDDVLVSLRTLGCTAEVLAKKLLMAGYVEGNEVNSSHRFVVADVKWWNFDENSPGLRASNMRSHQKTGVDNVQFRFDLTVLGEPLTAEAAAAMLSGLGVGDTP